jgi:nucleoid-associated protein YgaU
MGVHRSGQVAPQLSRGKHRAPTATGKTVARVATAGVVLTAVPMSMGAGVAEAAQVPTGVLDEIARCESGGSYTAQNPSSSASGKYQFIDSTWRAYRGDSSAARAKDASPAEQEAAARRLYAAQGTTPWNASKSCWGGRVSSGDPVGGGSTSSTKREVKKEAVVSDTKSQSKQSAKPKAAKPQASKSKVSKVAVQPGNGHHLVESGDTLSGLALRYTGDSSWRELYERNRDVVGGNPHLIVPGQVLEVRK